MRTGEYRICRLRFVLSHLSDKNKNVAKLGHPAFVACWAGSDYGFAGSFGGSVT
jgi:hypothetical protein